MKQSVIPCFLVAVSPVALLGAIVETLADDRNSKRSLVSSSVKVADWLQSPPSPHLDISGQNSFENTEVTLQGWLPWKVQSNRLLFAQASLHQQAQQRTLSAGLGVRYLRSPQWGSGYHLFYDQALQQNHRRLGLGAEVWRQSIKLSFNSYLPLSRWRNHPHQADEQVKPAKGFELILQGHLPRYPALGAELRYDRYRGDTVARLNQDKWFNNPTTFTAGIHYTPVPLIALSYRYQRIYSQQTNHQYGITLTYRLNRALKEQLAPTQTGLLLEYYWDQLVLRNPHILLEHRQQPSIKALPVVNTSELLRKIDDQFTQLKHYSKVNRDPNRPGTGKSATA